MRNVIILEEATQDIEQARDSYNEQEQGVGDYFSDSITTDILKLQRLSGIHAQHFEFFRMLGSTFRFGIYYRERDNDTQVIAILYLRRNPKWIRRQLHLRPEK